MLERFPAGEGAATYYAIAVKARNRRSMLAILVRVRLLSGNVQEEHHYLIECLQALLFGRLEIGSSNATS